MNMPSTVGASIRGIGVSVPDKVITNDDLATTLDTNDEWIVERTGIRRRHIGSSTRQLGIEAGQHALEVAGIGAEELDLIILATTSPDQIMPAGASTIQAELGANCGAFDLNAACSGFVYSLVAAHGFLGQGAHTVLVVGSETLSRFVDWDDRSTAILFGDAAGAAVLQATGDAGQLLGWHMGSKGDQRHILECDLGGYIEMEGREVFRQAVLTMCDSATTALGRAGLTTADVDVMVPHQANIRIIEAACKRLDIPMEKAITVIQEYGNTSSATIPLALHHAIEDGRVEPGQIVLLVGFGAGMTSASAVLRWPDV